jgi:electron transfer flavoprotein alpha subunit
VAGVFVYADLLSDGTPHPTALEILTKARELGEDVAAVALGPGAAGAAATLGEYGAKKVFASDDQAFADHLAQPQVHVLHELVQEHEPSLVLFGMTYDSRDVAGRLQARTGSTLMSNATDVLGLDKARTEILGGTKIVDVELAGPDPKLVIVRPKAVEPQKAEGAGEPEVIAVEASVPDETKQTKRLERHEEETEGPKLEEAKVIISGGRGLQDPSNFDLLHQLGKAIGNTAVGATRAVVDAGWVPYAMQIGQTGTTVKPDVYFAFGISGATQHLVGMKESKRIIAVNKDEDAPIFKVADVGVVGDALKLLPELIEEIKKAKRG